MKEAVNTRTQTVPPRLAEVHLARPVLDALRTLDNAGFQAYLVGGCVRDMMLGQHPKDYDIATDALPTEVQKLFKKVIPTGIEHGTVTVLQRGLSIEVTTFRTEGAYLDSRRPSTVSFGSDITEDLARRDFTINAMAFDPIGNRFCDPFGGSEDLARRQVRCVGDPQSRFAEDGLRPLRAVRFATVLNFDLDEQTREAIPKTLDTFRRIAAERVREEFTKLLLSPRVRFGIEMLRQTGLLGAFLPELLQEIGQSQDASYAYDVYGHTLATVEASPATTVLRLAALLHDVGKPRTAQRRADGSFDFPQHEMVGASVAEAVLDRLKFPRKTIEEVRLLVQHHRLEDSDRWSDPEIRRFAARLGVEHLEQLLQLAEANIRGRGGDASESLAALKRFAQRVHHVLSENPPLTPKALALNGNAIMRILGIGPSPAVGEATRFLMERVLENPAINSPHALTEVLQNWANSRAP